MENLMRVVDRLDELQASSVGRRECSNTRQRKGARRMDVHVDTCISPAHGRRAVATAQARVMEVSQGSGVCAWSCCHRANENKTRLRLFTHVISFYDAWISGVCRPKFTKPGTRVEQPSVIKKFFFRITIFCSVRRAECLRAGSENMPNFVTFWPIPVV